MNFNPLQFSPPKAAASRRLDLDRDKGPLMPMRMRDRDEVANRLYPSADGL
ncbi:MAG: hypothetical protein KKG09_08915 [Verrucomicrobia bacterium]|nr:hypothetical protein [Verrucomicrobiota bacterium]MCG2679360.1 hypothetical protein [Kiritimatiellia bacterium]MBU4248567.1 hypothetical protein [Verrucomicrobiota bacterium]MBU4291937.1 hypothetical protein [Verrucomicrobiota bacterium]MBU4428957.1 hypothetical protein [Verrucomicrobiota bacterium]